MLSCGPQETQSRSWVACGGIEASSSTRAHRRDRRRTKVIFAFVHGEIVTAQKRGRCGCWTEVYHRVASVFAKDTRPGLVWSFRTSRFLRMRHRSDYRAVEFNGGEGLGVNLSTKMYRRIYDTRETETRTYRTGNGLDWPSVSQQRRHEKQCYRKQILSDDKTRA